MATSFNDRVPARREHDCPVCHAYITAGTIVSPVAHDAILQRALDPGLTWGHAECSRAHGELTGRVPVYSTGRERLEEYQKCARCSYQLLPGSIAIRVVDTKLLAYSRLCLPCAAMAGHAITTSQPAIATVDPDKALLSAVASQFADGVTAYQVRREDSGATRVSFELLLTDPEVAVRISAMVVGLEKWKDEAKAT